MALGDFRLLAIGRFSSVRRKSLAGQWLTPSCRRADFTKLDFSGQNSKPPRTARIEDAWACFGVPQINSGCQRSMRSRSARHERGRVRRRGVTRRRSGYIRLNTIADWRAGSTREFGRRGGSFTTLLRGALIAPPFTAGNGAEYALTEARSRAFSMDWLQPCLGNFGSSRNFGKTRERASGHRNCWPATPASMPGLIPRSKGRERPSLLRCRTDDCRSRG